jgi:hypothetical protein
MLIRLSDINCLHARFDNLLAARLTKLVFVRVCLTLINWCRLREQSTTIDLHIDEMPAVQSTLEANSMNLFHLREQLALRSSCEL